MLLPQLLFLASLAGGGGSSRLFGLYLICQRSFVQGWPWGSPPPNAGSNWTVPLISCKTWSWMQQRRPFPFAAQLAFYGSSQGKSWSIFEENEKKLQKGCVLLAETKDCIYEAEQSRPWTSDFDDVNVSWRLYRFHLILITAPISRSLWRFRSTSAAMISLRTTKRRINAGKLLT